MCTKFELSDDDVDEEVTDEHILEIYPKILDWRLLAAHLGLTRPEVREIETEARQNEKLLRLYVLQEWKRKGALPETNTYGALIEAMIKADCPDLAQEICTKLGQCT